MVLLFSNPKTENMRFIIACPPRPTQTPVSSQHVRQGYFARPAQTM